MHKQNMSTLKYIHIHAMLDSQRPEDSLVYDAASHFGGRICHQAAPGRGSQMIERGWGSGSALLVCSLLAAGPLHAQSMAGSANAAMEREFQAAMTAQGKGDLDRAQSLLLALQVKHPGTFAIDESLGLVLVARENFAGALPLLEAATREQPSSDLAHANLGAAYFKLHRNQEALRELQRAARLNARNPATQEALGQLWMEAHQPKLAADAFAKAIEQKPGDPDLVLNRAQALKDAGLTGPAEELLAKLPGAGTSPAAQSLLGDIDEKNGAFEKAAQHYARAAALDPTEANAWALGVEFLRHWTFDAAIREFEAAAVRFPDSVRIRLGLGAAYFGGVNYSKAIPIFADLLDADSGNPLYAELLGLSCNAVTQEAKPRCGTLLAYAQAHPGEAKPSTYAAATLLDGQGTEEQTSLARRLLENALVADPKLADAQFQMGVLKQNESDWEGSLVYLKKAVALKPDFAQAHYRLALAYWRSGRKQDGQAEMELQRRYSKQQQEDLDGRLRQITTFLVDVHN